MLATSLLALGFVLGVGKVSWAEGSPSARADARVPSVPSISGAVKKSDRDVEIPKPLVTLIEKEYIQLTQSSEGQVSPSQDPLTMDIPRKLLDITLYLHEKTTGVLMGRKYKFSLPAGGGTIDLAQAVQSHIRGSFYIEVEVDAEEKGKEAPLRVFFVSQAKQREIDGRQFGMGCDKFADITSYFHSAMNDQGFVVNTTEQRYISVVGGTFFFIRTTMEGLYLGSLTLEDSRFPRVQCRKH